MTHLTADDLAALADEAGVTRLQVERMERAKFIVKRYSDGGYSFFYPEALTKIAVIND